MKLASGTVVFFSVVDKRLFSRLYNRLYSLLWVKYNFAGPTTEQNIIRIFKIGHWKSMRNRLFRSNLTTCNQFLTLFP